MAFAYGNTFSDDRAVFSLHAPFKAGQGVPVSERKIRPMLNYIHRKRVAVVRRRPFCERV